MGLKIAFFVGYIFENFRVPRVRRRWLMDQTNYLWQAAYLAAVCETDNSLMDGRILEARAALEQRLLSPIEDEEYRAIENAEKALEVLRVERIQSAGSGSSRQTSEPFPSSRQAFE
jgi:hypothetical protein